MLRGRDASAIRAVQSLHCSGEGLLRGSQGRGMGRGDTDWGCVRTDVQGGTRDGEDSAHHLEEKHKHCQWKFSHN
jgi:hypothetical protein